MRFTKASRAYTECRRDNGPEDLPDGSEGDGAKRPDPTSKEFRKAATACQDILDDIGVEGLVLSGRPGAGPGPRPA
ncbi:hypothetical protein ACIOKD_19370 [Streptomyces sp. NPDC087844]|uniref:hypothetical protein n=1 Tax=Streptomyces sp. NPDC087844 TaxID=3365805 RepID=UPI003811436C